MKDQSGKASRAARVQGCCSSPGEEELDEALPGAPYDQGRWSAGPLITHTPPGKAGQWGPSSSAAVLSHAPVRFPPWKCFQTQAACVGVFYRWKREAEFKLIGQSSTGEQDLKRQQDRMQLGMRSPRRWCWGGPALRAFHSPPSHAERGDSGPCILLLLFTCGWIILTFISKCRYLPPPWEPNTNTLIIQCLGHSPSNRDKNQHIQGTRKKKAVQEWVSKCKQYVSQASISECTVRLFMLQTKWHLR